MDLLHSIYWFCTDLCVNAANLLGITYIEFNFIFFVVLCPLLFVILVGLNLRRYLILPLIRKNDQKRTRRSDSN